MKFEERSFIIIIIIIIILIIKIIIKEVKINKSIVKFSHIFHFKMKLEKHC